MFYVPTDEDPEDRIAYRFANMPIEAEGTGPYFTPDEDTLFVNIQHPGELSNINTTSVYGQPATYNSYWPDGEKTGRTAQPVAAEAVDGGHHPAEALRGRHERDPAAGGLRRAGHGRTATTTATRTATTTTAAAAAATTATESSLVGLVRRE